MCGIAGIMTRDGRPPDPRVLDRLIETLGHRGPDGEGKHLSYGVGMVQTRLAIIDLETGDQPLYYVETPTAFSFASEPQALLAAGLVEPEVHPGHRDELLQTQFTCGAETIYRGIQRVLPGETLVVRSARVVDRYRRDALTAGPPAFLSEDSALKELDRVLEDSVSMHQRSDQSLMVGFRRLGETGGKGVHRVVVQPRHHREDGRGIDAAGKEQSVGNVRTLADRCNAKLTEVEFTEQDFWALLPRVAADIDDPAADYAVLPTWKLAQTAAQDLKVVLSGEGGDELFAGYGRYRSVLRPWWMGGRTILSKGAFDGLSVLRDTGTAWRDGIASAEARVAEFGWTALQRAQATDCVDWLPNHLLTKLDRCLMAHGLEGRTPFLDPVVANFAFGLPDGLKVRKHRGKWLLRRWLDKTVPEANAFDRKRGFTVPVAEWIRRHGTRLGELVADQPAVQEVCRPDRVRRLFLGTGKREGFAAWTLLFYALWHRNHLENAGTDGDVFEVLADRA